MELRKIYQSLADGMSTREQWFTQEQTGSALDRATERSQAKQADPVAGALDQGKAKMDEMLATLSKPDDDPLGPSEAEQQADEDYQSWAAEITQASNGNAVDTVLVLAEPHLSSGQMASLRELATGRRSKLKGGAE